MVERKTNEVLERLTSESDLTATRSALQQIVKSGLVYADGSFCVESDPAEVLPHVASKTGEADPTCTQPATLRVHWFRKTG